MGQRLTLRWTLDDAGTRRPVVNPRLRRALRAAATPELRDRLLAVRQDLAWRGRVMVAMQSFVLFPLMLLGLISLGQHESLPTWKAGAIAMAPMVIAVQAWLGSGIGNRHVRRAALKHHLCPSCAGDLAVEVPDPTTGRVRCGHCDGVWWRGEGEEKLVCRSCGYGLGGLPRGDDGLVRCPECGVGWREPRVRHRSTIAP